MIFHFLGIVDALAERGFNNGKKTKAKKLQKKKATLKDHSWPYLAAIWQLSEGFKLLIFSPLLLLFLESLS